MPVSDLPASCLLLSYTFILSSNQFTPPFSLLPSSFSSPPPGQSRILPAPRFAECSQHQRTDIPYFSILVSIASAPNSTREYADLVRGSGDDFGGLRMVAKCQQRDCMGVRGVQQSWRPHSTGSSSSKCPNASGCSAIILRRLLLPSTLPRRSSRYPRSQLFHPGHTSQYFRYHTNFC